MAETTYNPALVAKQWSKVLFTDVWNDQFFTKFTGTGPNSVIQVNTQLKGKGAGDQVTFGIVYKVEGDPIMDCNTLEGNEIPMTEDYMNITIHLYRQGIVLPCFDYSEYLSWIQHRTIAKEQLRNYFAELFDKEMFDKLSANPTSKRLWGSATSKLTLNDISGMKEMARMANPKIRPIRIDGADHYCLVMHPYVARDLKTTDEWKEIQAAAQVRGSSNPLFTGALGMWDNVILYEHENVKVDNPAAPTSAFNLLLGAQAGVLAESRDYFWRERDFEDYGQKVKIATGCIRGFEKTKFTAGKNGDVQDFGVITVQTAAAAYTPPA